MSSQRARVMLHLEFSTDLCEDHLGDAIERWVRSLFEEVCNGDRRSRADCSVSFEDAQDEGSGRSRVEDGVAEANA